MAFDVIPIEEGKHEGRERNALRNAFHALLKEFHFLLHAFYALQHAKGEHGLN